jgi:hypothetical protein
MAKISYMNPKDNKSKVTFKGTRKRIMLTAYRLLVLGLLIYIASR